MIELWTLPAEELLTAPNLGLAVWALLARYDGSAEVLLQRCRDRIDREGGPYTENLLAVAQVFAKLHFDKPEWLEILGGRKMLMDTPLIQEIGAEFRRNGCVETIIRVLQVRFAGVTDSITAGLKQVQDDEKLSHLTDCAVVCASLQEFENALFQALPVPPPPSTRGKRRPRKSSE